MGEMADSILDFAQPLINATDGSQEQINNALKIGQVCWNLALMPEKEREEHIENLRQNLNMEESEFREFRDSVIEPMVQRHHQMFPGMAQSGSQTIHVSPSEEEYPGTPRNAPCPCNSGKKFKRCCGK